MSIRYLLACLLLAFTASGAEPNIIFSVTDFRLQASAAARVQVSLTELGAGEDSFIMPETWNFRTLTNGILTLSNVWPGVYAIEIQTARGQTNFAITVPNVEGTLNAVNLLSVSTNSPSATMAYTQSASDARYARKATNSASAGKALLTDGTNNYWGEVAADVDTSNLATHAQLNAASNSVNSAWQVALGGTNTALLEVLSATSNTLYGIAQTLSETKQPTNANLTTISGWTSGDLENLHDLSASPADNYASKAYVANYVATNTSDITVSNAYIDHAYFTNFSGGSASFSSLSNTGNTVLTGGGMAIGLTNYGSSGLTNKTFTDASGWHNTNNNGGYVNISMGSITASGIMRLGGSSGESTLTVSNTANGPFFATDNAQLYFLPKSEYSVFKSQAASGSTLQIETTGTGTTRLRFYGGNTNLIDNFSGGILIRPANGVLTVQTNLIVSGNTTSGGFVAKTLNATNQTTAADTAMLFASTNNTSGLAEMYVVDEAGNVTLISPHAADGPTNLYDSGWNYVTREVQIFSGKVRWINHAREAAITELNTKAVLLAFTATNKAVWTNRMEAVQKLLDMSNDERQITITETFAEYNARTGGSLIKLDWGTVQTNRWNEYALGFTNAVTTFNAAIASGDTNATAPVWNPPAIKRKPKFL